MSSEKYYTIKPDGKYVHRMYKDGLGSIHAKTVHQAFVDILKLYGNRLALVSMNDEKYTYNQYYQICRKIGKTVIKMGLKKLDSVNIIGFNCPEYFFAYLGTIFAGCIATGVYATNNTSACKEVLDLSNGKIVIVDGKKQLEKYDAMIKNLNLKAIVVLNVDKSQIPKYDNIPTYDWKSFLEYGSDVEDKILDDVISKQDPYDCCAYVMTSGTTGNSKAVMISHDNYIWTAVSAVVSLSGMKVHEDMPKYGVFRMVSYLPLSHVAAQIVDIFLQLVHECEIWFARPDALKGTLKDTLLKCQPTLHLGVPRVWEKMYDKIKETLNNAGSAKKSAINWAFAKAEIALNNRMYKAKVEEVGCYGMVEKLLINKVKTSLGFMNLRIGVTSAAPLSYEILKYLCTFDLPIYEVLGASELAGPGSTNNKDYWKVGSCGRVILGGEMKTVPDSGEICFKGRMVFMGYKDMLDITQSSVDEDGWYHTGDTGVIDEDGFLQVKGRIKELLITAGGENISPVYIEEQIKSLLPCVSQATLIGDRRKFLSILLTLKTTMNEEGNPTTELSPLTVDIVKSVGSNAKTISEAKNCPKFKGYINQQIEIYNKEKAVSNAQGIRKWCILDRDYSVVTGEMTPTMKMMRPKIMNIYQNEIEAMYKE